jgi:hypothetical protein
VSTRSFTHFSPPPLNIVRSEVFDTIPRRSDEEFDTMPRRSDEDKY